ncbi:hypothetical protein B7494_g6026 [Chlorociboria aeruginascens]|nr:hypothetical protein B7494_g6026 [Chlorociboria aeruginascens]
MDSPPRPSPLHERSPSEKNAAIRLVPSTPPRLLGLSDEIYSRTPLPTHPSHILGPGGNNRDVFHARKADRPSSGSGSSLATTHQTVHQIFNSATGSPSSPTSTISKPLPKKRLTVKVGDKKTFSLVPHNEPQSDDSPSLSTKTSLSSLNSRIQDADGWSNSIISCIPESDPTSPPASAAPTTPQKPPISAGLVTSSPWNYQLVGGLRKVPKTPDLHDRASALDNPLPPLPETLEGRVIASHHLAAKPSFQSSETATTTSENTNYKIYRDVSPSASEVGLALPPSSDSNYQLLGDSSPPSSVIHIPRASENENYEVYGDSSPATSSINLTFPVKYSQESLVVPPLKPRGRRSNESLGYYKSRSRESLRAGSLTSISSVLSQQQQQEASRAIIGSGSLINIPVISKVKGSSSWAEPSNNHPPRSPMNEDPHQWSSQLSTVLSVSDGGTDRGSQSWSDSGRRSSAFPSTGSRHSHQVLSISSSLAHEEADAGSRSDSIEPPRPTLSHNGRRHLSSSSIRIVEDQDEHGDGITDMQDLRTRPSRTRLSGYYSISSLDNGRTSTMRSTGSSRANSMLASSMPTWARLYYGSGERRYLSAPGSSTEGSDSRNNSLRSGSPNTDHFPLSIYSPRRRPREVNQGDGRPSTRDSLEITQAPQFGGEEGERTSRRFRTWSMSSVWSPHLRLDRRATRHSIWEPPSINWSTDGGCFGRRNVQIVMFIVGFIFPFAWMIAAFLPLPPNPMFDMRERDQSSSNLDSSNDIYNDFARQFGTMDDARYESARWWRRLNRWMSLVGISIIAAVVVLVVISIEQSW